MHKLYRRLGIAVLMSAIMEQDERYSRARIEHPSPAKLSYLTSHAKHYVHSSGFERLAWLCGLDVLKLRQLTPKQASMVYDGRKQERRGHKAKG